MCGDQKAFSLSGADRSYKIGFAVVARDIRDRDDVQAGGAGKPGHAPVQVCRHLQADCADGAAGGGGQSAL